MGLSEMPLWQLATHPRDPRGHARGCAICPWSHVPLGPLGVLHRLTSPSHWETPLPHFQGGLWPWHQPRPPACGFSETRLQPLRTGDSGSCPRGREALLQRSDGATAPPDGSQPSKESPSFLSVSQRPGHGEDWLGVGWGVNRWTTRGACLSCPCSGAAGRVVLSVLSLVLASWESQPHGSHSGAPGLKEAEHGRSRGQLAKGHRELEGVPLPSGAG